MTKQTVPVAADDSLTIDRVGGDVIVQGWDRQEVEAGGDVLHVEREEGSLSISSGGDLSLSVPRGMRLSVDSIGGDATVQDLAGAVELRLIGGDANLRNLTGPVQLNGVVGGETHMENVANVSLGAGSAGPGFDVSDRIQRTIKQATQRAERKLRRAHADRLSRTYQVKFDGSRWRHGPGPDADSAAPAGEPVSEEERMTILRMLQEKKITSEEADKLLSALEGNA
jgi:hypothetical protein